MIFYQALFRHIILIFSCLYLFQNQFISYVFKYISIKIWLEYNFLIQNMFKEKGDPINILMEFSITWDWRMLIHCLSTIIFQESKLCINFLALNSLLFMFFSSKDEENFGRTKTECILLIAWLNTGLRGNIIYYKVFVKTSCNVI